MKVKMRCPVVYSATEINQWHLSEEYEPGKWRPARCCGFWALRNIKQQLRCAWRVLIGRYDAVNWGDRSGEKGFNFKDCTEPEFFTASRIPHCADRIRPALLRGMAQRRRMPNGSAMGKLAKDAINRRNVDRTGGVIDWIMDHLGWCLAFGIPTLMGLAMWAAFADQKEWDVYAKQHHCVVVGIKRGQVSSGLSMDGKGTMVTTVSPDQTIYTCDGGEMQIR